MALLKFKYQINHYLSIQPSFITIDGMRKLLKIYYDIPPEIFDRDRFLRPDNPEEIPQERLEVYAGVLGVSVEQLALLAGPEIDYNLGSINL